MVDILFILHFIRLLTSHSTISIIFFLCFTINGHRSGSLEFHRINKINFHIQLDLIELCCRVQNRWLISFRFSEISMFYSHDVLNVDFFILTTNIKCLLFHSKWTYFCMFFLIVGFNRSINHIIFHYTNFYLF